MQDRTLSFTTVMLAAIVSQLAIPVHAATDDYLDSISSTFGRTMLSSNGSYADRQSSPKRVIGVDNTMRSVETQYSCQTGTKYRTPSGALAGQYCSRFSVHQTGRLKRPKAPKAPTKTSTARQSIVIPTAPARPPNYTVSPEAPPVAPPYGYVYVPEGSPPPPPQPQWSQCPNLDCSSLNAAPCWMPNYSSPCVPLSASADAVNYKYGAELEVGFSTDTLVYYLCVTEAAADFIPYNHRCGASVIATIKECTSRDLIEYLRGCKGMSTSAVAGVVVGITIGSLMMFAAICAAAIIAYRKVKPPFDAWRERRASEKASANNEDAIIIPKMAAKPARPRAGAMVSRRVRFPGGSAMSLASIAAALTCDTTIPVSSEFNHCVSTGNVSECTVSYAVALPSVGLGQTVCLQVGDAAYSTLIPVRLIGITNRFPASMHMFHCARDIGESYADLRCPGSDGGGCNMAQGCDDPNYPINKWGALPGPSILSSGCLQTSGSFLRPCFQTTGICLHHLYRAPCAVTVVRKINEPETSLALAVGNQTYTVQQGCSNVEPVCASISSGVMRSTAIVGGFMIEDRTDRLYSSAAPPGVPQRGKVGDIQIDPTGVVTFAPGVISARVESSQTVAHDVDLDPLTVQGDIDTSGEGGFICTPNSKTTIGGLDVPGLTCIERQGYTQAMANVHLRLTSRVTGVVSSSCTLKEVSLDSYGGKIGLSAFFTLDVVCTEATTATVSVSSPTGVASGAGPTSGVIFVRYIGTEATPTIDIRVSTLKSTINTKITIPPPGFEEVPIVPALAPTTSSATSASSSDTWGWLRLGLDGSGTVIAWVAIAIGVLVLACVSILMCRCFIIALKLQSRYDRVPSAINDDHPRGKTSV